MIVLIISLICNRLNLSFLYTLKYIIAMIYFSSLLKLESTKLSYNASAFNFYLQSKVILFNQLLIFLKFLNIKLFTLF